MLMVFRVRPNILIANFLLVGTIGLAISYIDFKMDRDQAIATGIGAIAAITNLGGKILENNE